MAIVITGTAGTWSHNTAGVVVSVTGHGSKSPAAPSVWDDCEHGQAISARWDGAVPNAGPAGIQLKYDTNSYSQALPHSRGTHYLTGSHGGNNLAAEGNNVSFWKNRTVSLPCFYYVSWYIALNTTWRFGTAFNYKMMNYNGSTGGPYDLPNNWYMANAFPPSFSQYGYLDDSGNPTGLSLSFPDQNAHERYYGGISVKECNSPGTWFKYEHIAKMTTGTDGFSKFLADNVLLTNYAGKTDGYSGTGRSLNVGGYHGADDIQNPDNRRFFKDIYLDETLSRAVLTDSATYTTATIIEPQIPSAWDSSSVTVKVNLGKLPDTGTAWLFVFDATGVSNAVGFPITLGGSGGGGGGGSIPPPGGRVFIIP